MIDSIFRDYPIPQIFLYKKTIAGLGGGTSDKFEIVDGQQRLIAMNSFLKGEFKLFEVSDPRFRVPHSLRKLPAPWAGKSFDELSDAEKVTFRSFDVDVQLIESVSSADEIRDLFIRLQSGTALTPQQVRDAWPGNIGPYIQRLAGKMKQSPALELFELIDRRSNRAEDDDQKDPFVDHRSTCAQLLRTYLARLSGQFNFVNLSSRHLDALYHENPDFDPTGAVATGFELALRETQDVLKRAADISPSSAAPKKRKFRKSDVICLASFMQDMQADPLFKFDSAARNGLARFIINYEGGRGGKSPSGALLLDNYKQFRTALPTDIGIHLDPRRSFDPRQRAEIIEREASLCQICRKPVNDDDVEIDHFPISHARGGPTEVANGRLVHRRCHPRYGPLPVD